MNPTSLCNFSDFCPYSYYCKFKYNVYLGIEKIQPGKSIFEIQTDKL